LIVTQKPVFNCVPYHNGMEYARCSDGGGRHQVVYLRLQAYWMGRLRQTKRGDLQWGSSFRIGNEPL